MNNGEKIYIDCKDDLFAIQKAIDNLPAEGGTIIIPKGEWLTGPIHLKNNVELHLEKDSVLKFSQNFSDYTPAVFTRWEDGMPVSAHGKHEVAALKDVVHLIPIG